MVDYTQRPEISHPRLVTITEALAHWLPAEGSSLAAEDWTELDWQAAEWVAYWQNALPWLVARIRQDRVELPPAIWDRLVDINAESRERTRLMLDDTVEMLEALRQQGIDAIPLKGAALAPLYYRDPLIRPLGDIDLLIEEKHVRRVCTTLESLGYRYYSQSAEDVVYLRGNRKDNIWAADNVHPVEMHFCVREEYAGLAFELKDMLRHSSDVKAYWHESQALIPSTAATLAHVCAHASSDMLIQRGKLMQVADVVQLCDRMSPQDWQEFEELVTPQNARFLYPALAFATRYAALPAMAVEGITKLSLLCPAGILDWVRDNNLATASLSNVAPRDGLGLRMAETLAVSARERRQMWLRSLFPRRWNLSKRYPRLIKSPAWPVCYIMLNADRLWHILRNRVRP